ncbi:hypothetical protein I307_00295 [Cryptococcus deuterogattii 99/473]|uniref:Uncharacterized protein n=1 Tax=Cryptococcus deuterogattii Ram5 TaxID=1296110 RepID=A0A0D0V880_9TREE|nr:hypothetical protein I309_01085 [Cryptococcus deuterogattii LA55]KIR43666.1 hypothetical protein I313_00508 [Cryptococcus deuterogattii Ram5]KIR92669.1 hypothetical protein I304_03246 [Cryptococcus deuterogattii CBS 10090]KIY60492.1 hypothetical protein I307_00295 [Cryptococcus deuterogattii 99/473]
MSNSPFDPPAPCASASVNRSESPTIPGYSQDVDTTDNSPQTPCYNLPVSAPIAYSRSHIEPAETICLPSYQCQQSAQEPPRIDMGLPSPTDFPMMTEELPAYSKTNTEEPNTLAKALWKWGFLCPLLWFIGMTILWIPLKSTEEGDDPEKAQKLEEMIVILRKSAVRPTHSMIWQTAEV